MAENQEIVLVNKSMGRFTINFQGVFPRNKFAKKDGKIYLTDKEFDYVKSTFPHVLEGEEKVLYLENELAALEQAEEDIKKFFEQKPAKIKAAIAKMDEKEAESKLNYAQLNEVDDEIVKAIEDRILELDKVKE